MGLGQAAISSGSGVDASELSLLAITLSILSICLSYYTFRSQQKENIDQYLTNVWNDILDDSFANPQYVDITLTEHYSVLLSADDVLKYDIYCFKIWGHVEDILVKRLEKDEAFRPVIRWVAAYHYAWLERNPTFFVVRRFWLEIDRIRSEPNLIFGYRKLPTKNGTIDWSIIAEDYHSYILSPLAPEMTRKNKSGMCRNNLLNYLCRAIASQADIADFGCGPGNILQHLPKQVSRITLLDRNETVLKVAQTKAEKLGIDAEYVNQDIKDVAFQQRFDLVIAVNSILPEDRDEISLMLSKIRQSLKPGGRFIAIMPSFDTVIYLRSLWEKYYFNQLRDREHVARIIHSFNVTKKVDERSLSFADDGNTAQCYHTPQSLADDLKESGFALCQAPEKVYYPWALTKKFDYGYFPQAEEEIWDWFIVAERRAA